MNQEITFADLGLSRDLLENLVKIGYLTPTEIQTLAIPHFLQGEKDIIGQAQTGTGKTAAFGLPIIERIDADSRSVQALVLAPTRELAKQIADELVRLKGARKIQVLPIYGGQSYTTQFQGLKRGAQIVVATPGRIIDLLERKAIMLDTLRYVVLDEADEMLNMGFVDDVEKILSYATEVKRTLLFSATMPSRLKQIVDRYLKDKIEIKISGKELTVDLTKQLYYNLHEKDKLEALKRVIDSEHDFYGIVFCRTKTDTEELNNRLQQGGYPSETLHGDISQVQREKTIYRFKNRLTKILIATDVAARGIDVKGLSHVINFSIPSDKESYIHRIGRTGRAGLSGTAISFMSPADRRNRSFVESIAKGRILRTDPPSIKNIIKARKVKILNELQGALQNFTAEEPANSIEKHCLSMATRILTDISPEVAVSALLKMAYAGQLDDGKYRPIDTPPPERQRLEGRSRERDFSRRRVKCNPPAYKDRGRKVRAEGSYSSWS